MRKLLIIAMLLISVATTHAQMRISSSGEVSNFNQNYEFTKTCNYDHDSGKQWDNMPVNSTVSIRVDADGTGYLSIFLRSKVRFGIYSCTKKGDNYAFELVNQAGQFVQASLECKGNTVTSFWLYKQKDNTSIILFN